MKVHKLLGDRIHFWMRNSNCSVNPNLLVCLQEMRPGSDGSFSSPKPTAPPWHRPGQPREEAATVCLSNPLCQVQSAESRRARDSTDLAPVPPPPSAGGFPVWPRPAPAQTQTRCMSPWPQSTCVVDSDHLPPHTFSYRIQVLRTSWLAGFDLPLRPCPCDDSLDLLNPKTPFQSPQHDNASPSSARYSLCAPGGPHTNTFPL